MPKAISIPLEPEFDSGLVVPAPGDGASSAVIEAALQQLLNNDGFLNQLAGAVANNLASHIAATNPHQATPNAAADRLVLRDAEGRAAFGAPNAANHAARLADVAGAINGLPAVLRDPSAWSGLAGALLQVNEEEDGLEAAHISATQLNTLLETEVSCRVAQNGSVNNINGRVPITGAQVSNGIYTLTCPVGYEWHTATGAGENLEERRLVDVSRDTSNRRILHVNIRTAGGSLISVSHMVRGSLVRVP